ncbi:PREDICTED: diacylglycerol kinase 3 isoform X1 [Camelina sativa]|uniref:Diacylglycerol kinase 3 isoform X1 n=1 Tax=Camelina sativa TaxID=90675 RepID=A0ABM0YKC9_CAMSA|nr:PREDICTED: diacylglycerol kinase 3 isoform X1 [Camelina sativa]XP_010502337.1 PREDICTED: diacylglycerol kinase 3 isoform X1 [Camelina sativa]XP_010502338.1 PREDICTED: diacylglycerol kinase 3 isoform X1 [Camelina sativa]XP_010502339.1 PREDICTED: diacylglycerol kinase 3 isoform X1 [Camelina sativa]
MDSPLSKTDASKEKFVGSPRPYTTTADSNAMRGCGLANLTWVGVDKVELRQKLMMREYFRLTMRDCIKLKDSTRFMCSGLSLLMVVFINPKSGGHHGLVLKEKLQLLMSDIQVFYLTEVKPHEFVRYGLACLEIVAAKGDECAK